jgi:type II secretion system protein D
MRVSLCLAVLGLFSLAAPLAAQRRETTVRTVDTGDAANMEAALRTLAAQLNQKPQQPAEKEPAKPVQAKSDTSKPIDTTIDLSAIRVQATEGGVVLEGPEEAIEAMLRVIQEIDRLSLGLPEIRVVSLRHADSEALAKLLTNVYTTRTQGATGEAAAAAGQAVRRVGFVAIAQPNAIVVLAQAAEIDEVVEFVQRLDVESAKAGTQYKVFPLKFASATQVAATLQQFFTVTRENIAELRVRVDVVADVRTNTVIVHAGPEDMIKAEALIRQLDGEGDAINELRVFPLKNAVASELASLLSNSIGVRGQVSLFGQQRAGQQPPGQQPIGQQPIGLPFGQQPGQFGAAGPAGALGAQAGTPLKSSRLRFLTTDKNGKPVESGILEDVSIFSDDRTNSLIVIAPSTSMALVAELIRQLDARPGPVAELKVFTLRNADASAMLQTLQSIFQPQQAGAAGAQPIGGQAARAQQVTFALAGEEGALSLVPVNLSVDLRTNSIIASGSHNDLLAVQAVIVRLDADTARERKIIVYPLRNLTAEEAGQAIDNFLEEQAGAGAAAAGAGQDGALTVQQQIRVEVSVTPETVSNTLLISTTPRFERDILQLLEAIDRRPPQVVIQVLIAEVMLTDDEELGLEAGVQSSVLFDRSLMVRNTTLNAQENSLTPGFSFNSTDALQTPVGRPASEVGLQGISNFGLGRAAQQGFGGLVFAASSDNLSILLRALKRQQRLDVLSRPQIMTADNQTANISVGQNVPLVTGFDVTQFGVVNNVTRENVGVILEVTPRISPDGVVLMRVIPEVSSLAGTGVPIGTAAGEVIESPIINQTTAETTIAAHDGQTVVLGGLISSRKTRDVRKIPGIGNIPVLGWAFKTRFRSKVKDELLIILTPHIVHDEFDAQRIKDMEARRINWILGDVEKVHGDIGLMHWDDDDPANCDACKESGERCKKHGQRRKRTFMNAWRSPQIVSPNALRRGEVIEDEEPNELTMPEREVPDRRTPKTDSPRRKTEKSNARQSGEDAQDTILLPMPPKPSAKAEPQTDRDAVRYERYRGE